MQAESGLSAVLGAGLVILAATMWATVGVAVKLVPGASALDPEVLGLFRTLLAGPLVLFAAGLGPRRLFAAVAAFDLRRLFAFALAATIFQICLFRTFDALGVTLTVVLTVCLPPVISLIWSLARGVPFGRGALVALALAMAGLGLCAFAEGLDSRQGHRALGLVLAFVASLAFVWMSDTARTLSRCGPPVLVAGLGLTLSGLIFCLLVPLLSDGPLPVLLALSRDSQMLALLVYLAVIPTALAYVCYCRGMALSRSTTVGLTASMIEPAIAALLAALLLHERLSQGELSGCLLMIVAIVILVRSEAGRQPAPAASGDLAGKPVAIG
jgi:drug/metabolite transporter, DME family